MRFFITLTRMRLILIFALMALMVLLIGAFRNVTTAPANAATSEDRIAFAQSIGCRVDSEHVTEKNITIPQQFSDVYRNYNELQQTAGYDLSDYRGCTVTGYTYRIKAYGDHQTTDGALHLLVYRGRIIGGDIASVALDGSMLPLCIASKSDKGVE